MYRTSRDNPYTPDIDITHLYILLYLNKGNGIPIQVETYQPLLDHLHHLKNNYYIEHLTANINRKKMNHWRLTGKGRSRIEVYKTFNQVIPKGFQHIKDPIKSWEAVSYELKSAYYYHPERTYMYSYESLLVYQLNQALQRKSSQDLHHP